MRCVVCELSPSIPFLTVDGRDYWRCLACLATFLDPAQLPSAEIELAQYKLHRNDPNDAGYRAFLNRVAQPLLARLSPGSRGLDFGCGPGPVLAGMLREAGHAMALFDPFFYPDRDVLNDTYDFITCTEVAEHFHRPAQAFNQLDGMLKPGGWLAVMTTLQVDDAGFANWYYRRDPTHVVFYRQVTLQTIARRFGLDYVYAGQNASLMFKPLRSPGTISVNV